MSCTSLHHTNWAERYAGELACAGVRPARDMGDWSSAGPREYMWCTAATAPAPATAALPGTTSSAVSAHHTWASLRVRRCGMGQSLQQAGATCRTPSHHDFEAAVAR